MKPTPTSVRTDCLCVIYHCARLWYTNYRQRHTHTFNFNAFTPHNYLTVWHLCTVVTGIY